MRDRSWILSVIIILVLSVICILLAISYGGFSIYRYVLETSPIATLTRLQGNAAPTFVPSLPAQTVIASVPTLTVVSSQPLAISTPAPTLTVMPFRPGTISTSTPAELEAAKLTSISTIVAAIIGVLGVIIAAIIAAWAAIRSAQIQKK